MPMLVRAQALGLEARLTKECGAAMAQAFVALVNAYLNCRATDDKWGEVDRTPGGFGDVGTEE